MCFNEPNFLAYLIVFLLCSLLKSMREKSIRCERCGNRSGVLVECTGSCGTFYHRLCLQIECLDGIDWNAKKEHLCLRCRNIDITSSPDESNTYPSLDVKAKANAPQTKSTTSNARKGKLDEVEQYFDRKSSSGRGKKSTNDEGTKTELVVPTHKECIAEVEALYRQSNADLAFEEFELQYKQHFYEWSFSMATNQSILLYGLGSKISLLNSFGQYLAQEGDVMSINGYDPRVDLSQFLDYMDQMFCDRSIIQHGNPQMKSSRKGLSKKAAFIAKSFASKRSRPLFILIHNIDGAGLCNPYAQDAIATLSSNSKKYGSQLIRIVASVDNVNAAMVLWSPQVEHKFDWVSNPFSLLQIILMIKHMILTSMSLLLGVEESPHIPTLHRRSEIHASNRSIEKGQETKGHLCWCRFSGTEGSGLSCTTSYRGIASTGIFAAC